MTLNWLVAYLQANTLGLMQKDIDLYKLAKQSPIIMLLAEDGQRLYPRMHWYFHLQQLTLKWAWMMNGNCYLTPTTNLYDVCIMFLATLIACYHFVSFLSYFWHSFFNVFKKCFMCYPETKNLSFFLLNRGHEQIHVHSPWFVFSYKVKMLYRYCADYVQLLAYCAIEMLDQISRRKITVFHKPLDGVTD